MKYGYSMDGKNADFKFSKKHTKIKKIEILLFFKKEDTLKKQQRTSQNVDNNKIINNNRTGY